MMDKWQALHRRFFYSSKTKLMLDWEGLGISDEFIAENESLLAKAFAGMDALESGAIANPDEGRMVGHYWLRAPELAPNGEISAEIADCLKAVTAFT
ncbi:MAG: glucose-6-phosphate isomerase, partial [Oscillospiraceae bacterium]|nr:glucose-6-phosphate isomerase [Oscillospiraceae bacterium]